MALPRFRLQDERIIATMTMHNNMDNPIDYGRTAEIYVWEQGQILKLFYDWVDREAVEHEARVARAVHAGGLPAPAVGEIMRVNDRWGLIYQRAVGDPMWQVLSRKPWRVIRYARRMAELHAQIHTHPAPQGVPSQRQKLANKIRSAVPLPAHLRSKSLAALDSLPNGNALCHGDFHPFNILISPRGETVIDWIDASSGNPLADLARSSVLALGAVETGQIGGALPGFIVRLLHSVYLSHYFRLRPIRQEEYKRWIPIVAAARASEGVPEIEWLIAKAEANLRDN